LAKQAGRLGYLEIVDGDTRGGYAWLSIGRFAPAVVAVPSTNPGQLEERRETAARLVADFRLAKFKSQARQHLANDRIEGKVRATLARALLEFDPDIRLSGLVFLLNEPGVSRPLKRQITGVIRQREEKRVDETLVAVFKNAPEKMQQTLAQSLAGNRKGADALLNLVERGLASPRLLQIAAVRTQLLAAKPANAKKRIDQLTEDLPSLNEAIRKLISERISGYKNAKTSAKKGADIFAKNCAACHQIAGKGEVVGPQLDGIGNRGLERIAEDLLDPNRNVDVAFRTTNIVTVKGKVISGLVRREEGAVLIMIDNKGKKHSVPLKDIDEKVRSNLSLMPGNQAQVVEEENFYNLLAYLLKQTKTAAK